jgi:hypothetical protein
MTPLPVRREPLQPPDRHCFVFSREGAELLALALLGADPAADRRQKVRFLDDRDRTRKIAFADRLDKAGDRHTDRTAGDAERLFALKAAACFKERLFRGIPQGDLLEVRSPDRGLLLGDGGLLRDDLFGLLGFHGKRVYKIVICH